MIAKFFRQMFILVLFMVLPGTAAFAFDFSDWDVLLKKYVAQKTIDGVVLNAVDYKKVAKDPAYSKLLKALESSSISTLKTKEEKLTFWINVYNVMAVKMILDNYPLESIKDAGSLFTAVWKKDVGKVGGKTQDP